MASTEITALTDTYSRLMLEVLDRTFHSMPRDGEYSEHRSHWYESIIVSRVGTTPAAVQVADVQVADTSHRG
jgi:hypothetical protein